MTRLERRNYTDQQLGLKHVGSIMDIFDDHVKVICRMTDEEYDHYCDIATDDELELLIQEQYTFAQKRQLITILTTKIYKQ